MFISMLKSELYRASKMACTYVLPVILIVAVLITGVTLLKLDMYGALGMTEADYEELTEKGNSAEGIADSFQMGFNAGIDASTATLDDSEEAEEEVREIHLWGEGVFYHDDIPTIFYGNVTGLLGILYMAIFTGIFIGDVYKYKYDKNLIIGCHNRLTMMSARVVVVAIYSFLMHLLMLLATILSAAMMAEGVVMNIDKSFILYFLITWFLTFAFSLIVMAITVALRSKAAGITIGVILSCGVFTIVVSLATLIARAYLSLPDDFDFSNYFCSQNLAMLSLDSDGAVVLRAIVVALVYSVLGIVGSGIITKKRDIV